MTIPWEAISDTLLAWVEKSTGLTTVWREEERPFHKQPGIALLHIISTRSRGVDDIRRSDNEAEAPEPNCETQLSGVREFTLSIQVETQSQKPGKAARCYLESARTCLRLPSVLGKLQGQGVALIETLPTVLLDHNVDEHMASRANMDIRFAVADCKDDDAVQSIEKVLVSTVFRTDPCGAPLPVPPNVEDLEIEMPTTCPCCDAPLGGGSDLVFLANGVINVLPLMTPIDGGRSVFTDVAIDKVRLTQILDGAAGDTVAELYRCRGGVVTSLGTVTLAQGGGLFSSAEFSPASALRPLLEDDVLYFEFNEFQTGAPTNAFVEVTFS